MSLFHRFKDEQEFRESLVKPLLNRLGFLRVVHTHGNWELGKDFVFSEVDRFGLFRHYVAQVKHEEAIGLGGNSFEKLWSQVQQAMTSPFSLADSPRECKATGVYVFNSGRITEQAKTDLLNRLKMQHFSECVAFLDGDRIEMLDKWGTARRDENLRSRLIGLKRQIEMNIYMWNLSLEGATTNGPYSAGSPSLGTYNMRGSITHGIEEFATNPVLPDKIPMDEIVALWEDAKFIDRFVDNILAGLMPFQTREASRQGIITLVNRAIPRAQRLLPMINEALANLGTL